MNDNWKKTVFSDGSQNFVSNPLPKLNEKVNFSIRLSRGVKVEKIFFAVYPKGEAVYYRMEKSGEDDFFQYFNVEYHFDTLKLIYKFYLIVGGKEYFYTAHGLFDYEVPDFFSFTIYSNADYSQWTPEAVFYQIFPDRFNRVGETPFTESEVEVVYRKKKVKLTRKLTPWNSPIINLGKTGVIQYYGGNLDGIREKIPYLKELGITALYLTPIFKAKTNHRYDTEDYNEIDPLLGTQEDFVRLVNELHANGIRIILDGVLNHTGLFHPWFDYHQEHGEVGAYHNPKSRFRNYYYFREDNTYESWMDSKILPQLNLENPEVKDALFHNKDSVLKKWLGSPFCIDGWRMDTAQLLGKFPQRPVDMEVSREIRAAIKSVNPDAYVMGESFYDPHQLIDYDRYEAVMNYRGFGSPLKKWLTGQANFLSFPEGDENQRVRFSAQQAAAQMRATRSPIPFQNQIRMYNLLNSHDTPRFFTLLKKNDKKYRLAVTLLFTGLGIPSIYYGDEIGLEGSHDPDCRRPMIWDFQPEHQNRFEFIRELIAFRKAHPVLTYGSFIELYSDKSVMAYARFLDKKVIITIANSSNKPRSLKISLEVLGIRQGKWLSRETGKITHSENTILEYSLFAMSAEILILQ